MDGTPAALAAGMSKKSRIACVRIAGLALVIAVGAAPSSAHASTEAGLADLGTLEIEIDSAFLPSIVMGAATLGFGATDIVFAVLGRPLPPALAVAQLLTAGVIAPAWELIALESSGLAAHDRNALRALALVDLAWFTAHGVYNLIAYRTWSGRKNATNPQLGAGAVWRWS